PSRQDHGGAVRQTALGAFANLLECGFELLLVRDGPPYEVRHDQDVRVIARCGALQHALDRVLENARTGVRVLAEHGEGVRGLGGARAAPEWRGDLVLQLLVQLVPTRRERELL